MTENQKDLAALKRCQAGDVGAVGMLFDHFGDRVFRLSLNLLGCHAEAEDATQEIFLRIYDKAGTFAGRSKVSTWVHRLTVNFCLNLLKARKRRPLTLVDGVLEQRSSAELDASGSMEQCETAALVHSLLARLPAEARTIFVLREVDGCSYQDIGEILDIAPGTVMSRLSRARDKFRQLASASAESLGVKVE
ncbi:MAG: sigma-70 family RNA polymerase sigma factor [Planctomycetes bacterium]|nr:sigma-70 family RNA polymerase sigma factor [Planctomycetota bacterium]MCP4770161.1 sigma-70 family RNA polymerase sigma factor [Planctomycetota bacterium]MCP4860691.1 sigma-70 family RNA polymerase sigma factor [Planctomycetota bacterium]